MLTWYWKTFFTALVTVAYIWATSAAMRALSSASDLGVVLGLAGFVTASFLAIWLTGQIFKNRKGSKNAKTSGSTGGVGTF
jgi:hypothetical protein